MDKSHSGGFHGFLLLLSRCSGPVVKWLLSTSPCPISGHHTGEKEATSSAIAAGGRRCFSDWGILISSQRPGVEGGPDDLGVPVARRRVLGSPSMRCAARRLRA